MSEAGRTKFLLGNLISDSSRLVWPKNCTEEQEQKLNDASQIEKIQTHFRSDDDLDLCIQVPIIEKFTNKYGDLILRDMSALGYLFHLYTDKIFFEDLFSRTFMCEVLGVLSFLIKGDALELSELDLSSIFRTLMDISKERLVGQLVDVSSQDNYVEQKKLLKMATVE